MTGARTDFPMIGKKQCRFSSHWKKYPTYRDSGVEWLGEVPSDWDVWKASHAFGEIGSGTTPASESPEYYEGDIPWVTTGELRETLITDAQNKLTRKALSDHPTLRMYQPGTVLIAMYGATIGRLGILGLPACTNQACCALAQPRRLDPKFTYLWLQAFRGILINLSSGGGQPNINQEKIRAIRIAAPEVPEQRAIAEFLDRETGRIDALIAKKERQIELLQEKRQALITHAVTKGFPSTGSGQGDLNAKMKDSGVEWLGKIPEGWEVKQFRRVTTRIDVGIAEAATHAYCDAGVPIVRSTNIRENRILTDDLLYVEPWFAERNRSKYLYANDLVTVRTGAPGVTAVVPPELDRCQCFTLLVSTLKRGKDPRYFSYFLNSASAKYRFAVEGWGTAQINISVPILQEQVVVDPPHQEQRLIADYLNRETAAIDALAAKIESSIALLREYRTALISAAVTGKIDVRQEEG